MFQVHHKTVSEYFYDHFIQLSDIYGYSTTQKKSVFLNLILKRQLVKRFFLRGSNLWEEIVNLFKDLNWNLFKNFTTKLLHHMNSINNSVKHLKNYFH